MLHFEILVKEVIEKQINSCIHHLYRELDIKVQSFLLLEKEANRCKKKFRISYFPVFTRRHLCTRKHILSLNQSQLEFPISVKYPVVWQMRPSPWNEHQKNVLQKKGKHQRNNENEPIIGRLDFLQFVRKSKDKTILLF